MWLMKEKKLGFAIIISILTAMLMNGMVFAEGETLPDTPPALEESADGVMMDGPVVIDAIEETPAVDAITAEEKSSDNGEASPAVITSGGPTTSAQDETLELANALAETGVVLADVNGDALEMVRESTAEAVRAGDPWWKVGGVTYSTEFIGNCDPAALGVTCWESTTPINEALNRIGGGLFPTDGKLYVLAGTYSDVININATGTLMENFKGIIGVPSNLNGSYTTFLTGNVTIQGTLGGFTLSGFDITSNVTFSNNSGTLTLTDLYVHKDTGSGINVSNHNGTINVTNVRAEGNSAEGARLDNTASTSAAVNVVNSSFNFNTVNSALKPGLFIKSNGVVTLNGVASSHNNGNGLEIVQAKTVTIKNSVFSENYAANAGFGYGVRILLNNQNTNVTLENVFANSNDNTGVYVMTQGKISIKNMQSSLNGEYGAYLDNCDIYSGGVCLSPYKNTVTINGAQTDENDINGIQVISKGGVTLTSIRARDNGLTGVLVDNCVLNSGVCQGTGAVTINSPASAGESAANDFSSNGNYGLYVESFGAISLSNFKADNNGATYSGVVLDNRGSSAGITVSATIADFRNQTIDNDSYGIWFRTKGNVSLAKLNSSENTRAGAYIDNDEAIKNVSVSDSSFYLNQWHGLWIESKGNVTLTNISAHDNDPTDSGSYHGLHITGGGNGTISLKSTSSSVLYDFSNNSGRGININNWLGAVSIKSVIADMNGDSGVMVDNDSAVTPKTVTLAKVSANSNIYYGIYINSAGGISAQDLSVNGNGFSNVHLENCLVIGGECMGSGGITISGSKNEFNNSSSEYGLYARSKGTITLMNFSANNNALAGVYLSNQFDNASGDLVIKTSKSSQMNTAASNGLVSNSNGITLYTNGGVTLQNVDVRANTTGGAYIFTTDGGLVKTVNVARSQFSGNNTNGLEIHTDGPVILTDTSASSNGWWGATIMTSGNVNVTCSGASSDKCQFSDNTANGGLYVETAGTITVSKVAANANGNSTSDYGIELLGGDKAITISKVTTIDNLGRGIYTVTNGNITLTSAFSAGNYYGAQLANNSGTGNIMVNGTNFFENNNQFGLHVQTSGTVSMSNVTAAGSSVSDGVFINANSAGKAVTLTNVVARYNNRYGVRVEAIGKITLNHVHAMQNTSHGLSVIANGGEMVTIKNSNFLFNGRNGINADVLDPLDMSKFKLSGVNYYGNDALNIGVRDLLVY
jgi:hypothetical protein